MPADDPDNHDGYTLRGKGDIIDKFRAMIKKPCLLTARIPECKTGLVTTVVDVLPERGLAVFDVGVDDAANRRFVEAQDIVFTGQVEGIKIRFTVPHLREAVLHGYDVFAAPLPESLYWHQQRKFYRVPIPLAMPVKCQVPLAEARIGFPILDLSITGLALYDKQLKIGDAFDIGVILEGCALELPGREAIRMGLEIRNKTLIAKATPLGVQRVGCAFLGVGRSDEVALQKFIYEVELYKKRQDGLVKT